MGTAPKISEAAGYTKRHGVGRQLRVLCASSTLYASGDPLQTRGMAQHEGTFDRAAAGSLAALGGSPDDGALDLWLDPAGAAEALRALSDPGAPSGKGAVLVRAALDLAAGEPGFGPDP